MTTAQLITELEKRGVLAFEKNDEIIWRGNVCSVLAVRYSMGITELKCDRPLHGGWHTATDCTHSADDPRLLGRVLRELGRSLDSIHSPDIINQTRWIVTINHPDIKLGPMGANEMIRGDTLLEAALKALLAKVEGGD